jgi:acetylornithine/N-succinyldiaminopimelate aminotransferase
MTLFDVYPQYPIAVVKGQNATIWDDQGAEYLDFYGGHAVISVGHSHPHYVKRISDQLGQLGFYSNAVQLPIQAALAEKLGEVSGYADYQLFLCSSGAEANENAFKLAGFQTGRMKIIVFERGFHGRTSLAVAATDNHKIVAPMNETDAIIRLPFNDLEAVKAHLDHEVAAVCIEGIQGIAGIYVPEKNFLKEVQQLCKANGSLLILDEVQSGFGRSGRFFAHQHADIQPDIISMAKGMGNGFPIGGILIAPDIHPWHGMLGTTYGGNPLACAASLAVLEIIEQEQLVKNAEEVGEYLMRELASIEAIKEVRGKGLMIGIEFPESSKSIRTTLLNEHHIFTGSASDPNTMRLLPPLNITKEQVDHFMVALKKTLL